MRKNGCYSAKRFTPRQQEVVAAVKSAILMLLPDAEVILYGSRARGTAGPESDWDFLVLTDEAVTIAVEERVCKAMFQVSLDLAETISAFIENRYIWQTPLAKASPYHQEVDREGIAV